MSIQTTFGEYWVRALERRNIIVVGDTITPAVASIPAHPRAFLQWLAGRYNVVLP